MSDIDAQIDQLAEDLNRLFTITENMTQPPNYQLVKLYIDTIPNYDGNPHTLNVFIANCENLLTTFCNQNNQPLNNFLLRAVIGKLAGRALILIGSRTELTTWGQIKDALTLSFGDQRNIDCLVQDLIVLQPMKNETPYNFGMRCQDARSLIVSKINPMTVTAEEKTLRLQNYDDLSLKTFIRGLPGQLQNNIRLRNPDSLEKAMSLVIEEENFLYCQKRSNSLNQQTSFTPSQRMIPASNQKPIYKSQNYPNYQNHQQPGINSFPQTQFPQNQFSQNKFLTPQLRPNIQQNLRPNIFQNSNQRWKPNNNFPTQRHPYFSQNTQQIPRNQNQNITRNTGPEPMDTTSANSRIKTPQSTQKRFTHAELFNQDINPEPENPNYNFPNDAINYDENYDGITVNNSQDDAENLSGDYVSSYCGVQYEDPTENVNSSVNFQQAFLQNDHT